MNLRDLIQPLSLDTLKSMSTELVPNVNSGDRELFLDAIDAEIASRPDDESQQEQKQPAEPADPEDQE